MCYFLQKSFLEWKWCPDSFRFNIAFRHSPPQCDFMWGPWLRLEASASSGQVLCGCASILMGVGVGVGVRVRGSVSRQSFLSRIPQISLSLGLPLFSCSSQYSWCALDLLRKRSFLSSSITSPNMGLDSYSSHWSKYQIGYWFAFPSNLLRGGEGNQEEEGSRAPGWSPSTQEWFKHGKSDQATLELSSFPLKWVCQASPWCFTNSPRSMPVLTLCRGWVPVRSGSFTECIRVPWPVVVCK